MHIFPIEPPKDEEDSEYIVKQYKIIYLIYVRTVTKKGNDFVMVDYAVLLRLNVKLCAKVGDEKIKMKVSGEVTDALQMRCFYGNEKTVGEKIQGKK